MLRHFTASLCVLHSLACGFDVLCLGMSSEPEAARLLPDEDAAASSLTERRTGRGDEAEAAWARKQARLEHDGRQREGFSSSAALAAAVGALLPSPSSLSLASARLPVLLTVAGVAALLLLVLLSAQLQSRSPFSSSPVAVSPSAAAPSSAAASSPAPLPSPSSCSQPPAQGEGSGLRVLVAMFDSRALGGGGDGFLQDTVSMAAYLNYLYTRLHRQHEFVFVHAPPIDAGSGEAAGAGLARQGMKRLRGCYNGALQQWRAAPWCKIVAVHHLLSTRSEFDWLLFIDSDAVFSNYMVPVDFWLQAVADWAPSADSLSSQSQSQPQPESRSSCSPAAFLAAAPASRCTVLFANNDPWDKGSVNTGLWLLRRGGAAATNHSLQFLRRWWHQSMPQRNFQHAYEQDALQLLLRRMPEDESGQLTALLREPSMIHRSALQLVHHWTHTDSKQRGPSFRRLVRRMQTDSRLAARCIDTNSTRVMQTIAHAATVTIDTSVDSIALPDSGLSQRREPEP